MALILGRIVKDDPYDHLPFTIGNTFLVSTWLTTLFAVVAGTLLFTSEVQHGTLAGSLTSRPVEAHHRRREGRHGRRTRVRHGCARHRSAASSADWRAAWTPATCRVP